LGSKFSDRLEEKYASPYKRNKFKIKLILLCKIVNDDILLTASDSYKYIYLTFTRILQSRSKSPKLSFSFRFLTGILHAFLVLNTRMRSSSTTGFSERGNDLRVLQNKRISSIFMWVL
jgi:hypothetical protein